MHPFSSCYRNSSQPSAIPCRLLISCMMFTSCIKYDTTPLTLNVMMTLQRLSQRAHNMICTAYSITDGLHQISLQSVLYITSYPFYVSQCQCIKVQLKCNKLNNYSREVPINLERQQCPTLAAKCPVKIYEGYNDPMYVLTFDMLTPSACGPLTQKVILTLLTCRHASSNLPFRC